MNERMSIPMMFLGKRLFFHLQKEQLRLSEYQLLTSYAVDQTWG